MTTHLISLALIGLCVVALFAARAEASTVAQARKEVHRLWGSHAPRMLCVIRHESGWNPTAVSRTGDHGLLQLNAYSWRRHFGQRWHQVYDPVANVRMGYEIWRTSGFRAWTASRYC